MAADCPSPVSILEFGRAILHDEAQARDALADGLDGPFEDAVRLIMGCKGKLIVSGLGKSGHVGRKIAATFASTGTTAVFLHLAEAMHGDLGMVAAGDVAILISRSGETTELEPVIDHFRNACIPIIAITGHTGTHACRRGGGYLAAAALAGGRAGSGRADDVDDHEPGARRRAGDDRHATEGVHADGLWPAASGRSARGAAQAGAAADARRRRPAAHGRKQPMHDTVVEMSEKRRGVVGVTDRDGYLVGVITDGDLRRNIERGLDHTAAEFMTRNPKTIGPDDLVDDALALLDEYKITSLFVVESDGKGRKPVGVLHIHDCPAAR